MTLISKFFILFLVFAVALHEASDSSSKRSCNDELNESFTISSPKSSKRTRTMRLEEEAENELVAVLLDSIQKKKSELYSRILQKNGCQVLNYKENEILKHLLKSNNSEFLFLTFTKICSHNVPLLLDAAKLATSFNEKPVMFSLIKSIYDPFYPPPTSFLGYFVERSDFESISVFIELDFVLEFYRRSGGKNLVHFLVENDQINLIKDFKRLPLFEMKDNFGRTPIFYAKSARMIKIIRRIYPKSRDQVDYRGTPAWQAAFLANDQILSNALISFKRRISKYKKTFLNYYKIGWVSTASILRIDRENILKTSFAEVQKISNKWYNAKNEFFIKYLGENGIDNGGLKVDWINNLMKIFFTENESGSENNFTAPLFLKIDDETGVYAPNIKYDANIFKFAGSIVGISIALNVPIKVKFIPAIYKAIFYEELDLEADLIEQSPTVHRNMKYLLQPDVNLRELELTFPSNPNLRVIKRNLHKYIEEYSRYTLQEKYKNQIDGFVEGFLSVQSQNILNFMSKSELTTVLLGKSDFTGSEFVASCKCIYPDLLVILEQIVDEFTVAQRSRLLKFITGSEVLPYEGFSGLKNGGITVEVNQGFQSGPYPTSSTCFNTIRLPAFMDYLTMKESLIVAIETTDRIDNEVGVIGNEGIILGLDDNDHTALLNSHEVDIISDVSDDDDDDDDDDNFES